MVCQKCRIDRTMNEYKCKREFIRVFFNINMDFSDGFCTGCTLTANERMEKMCHNIYFMNYKMFDDEMRFKGKYLFEMAVNEKIVKKDEWEKYKYFFCYVGAKMSELMYLGLSKKNIKEFLSRLAFAVIHY